MSLPILSNRSGHAVWTQLVLGAVLLLSGCLLSGCARGPRWSVVPQWGRPQARVVEPPKETGRSGDDTVGRATVRRSVITRSGNVFAALINRRRPGEELSDDPFLNASLAKARAHSRDSVDHRAIQTPTPAPPRSSPIRQVDVKTSQGRSQLVDNRDSPPAAPFPQPSQRRRPSDFWDRPSVKKYASADEHDQMSRLRTAMKKSDRRGTRLADQIDARAAKVRVDDMMRDVRLLRQKGKLSDAYRTALSARELVKTSRIFYGPDEEQPGDLVHQLRRELRAAGHEPPDEPSPLSAVSAQPKPSQPAVAGTGKSPAELPSRRRPARKRSGPPPFPEFIPPQPTVAVRTR